MRCVPSRGFPTRPAPGFGLAELLVGMAIGLVTMLVVVQVVVGFDRQKRVATGSADAQTNGAIAIYMLQRQLQAAGYGLPLFGSKNPPHSCPSLRFTVAHGGKSSEIDLFPVEIRDGGDGLPDAVVVRAGAPSLGGVPLQVVNVSGNEVDVTNHLGCEKGDLAFMARNGSCALTVIDDMPGGSPSRLVLASASGFSNGATMACIGAWGKAASPNRRWTESVFAVAPDYTLTESVNGAAPTPRASGVANLQARYGIADDALSSRVTAWVDATGRWGKDITMADRMRIRAVRIAVVARDGQWQKDTVSNACTTTRKTVSKGPCAWDDAHDDAPAPAIDLSRTPDNKERADWRHFRYRAFEVTVPLRNMIWAAGAAA